MKSLYKLFTLIFVIGGLVFLSSCNSSASKITQISQITPEKYDWYILVSEIIPDKGENAYNVECRWLGDINAHQMTDHFAIQVSNQPAVDLHRFFEDDITFDAELNLEPGREYTIKLFKNGSQITSGTLQTPHQARAVFPDEYNPRNAAHVSWELEHDNQQQLIGAFAFDWGDYPYANLEYSKQLTPRQRSFNIPANAVDYIADLTYFVVLMQINVKTNGRTAVIGMQAEYEHYRFETEHYPVREQIKMQNWLFRAAMPNIISF